MLKNHDLLRAEIALRHSKNIGTSTKQGLNGKMGQICAFAVIHGGPAPSFILPAFAAMLLGIDFQPTIEDVLNQNIKSEI